MPLPKWAWDILQAWRLLGLVLMLVLVVWNVVRKWARAINRSQEDDHFRFGP